MNAPSPPRSVPASLGLPLSCWPQAPAVLAGRPRTGLEWPGHQALPFPPPHPHTGARALCSLGSPRRRREEADGHGLSGQAARPSRERSLGGGSGEAGRAGRRPACGFRLHGGTFPHGPSWEGCARARVGSIPVIFLSTWHCDQAALLAGRGQACVRGGVLEASSQVPSGGLGQPAPSCLGRQAGAGCLRHPLRAPAPIPPRSHHCPSLCSSDPPSRPKCAAAPCPSALQLPAGARPGAEGLGTA